MVLKIFAIFLFECPFYVIQRVTLAVNVIGIFTKKTLEPSRKSTGSVFLWTPLS